MWNTKNDISGWNLDKDSYKVKHVCNYRKEDNKCSMATLIPCDYRNDGKCTQRTDF